MFFLSYDVIIVLLSHVLRENVKILPSFTILDVITLRYLRNRSSLLRESLSNNSQFGGQL